MKIISIAIGLCLIATTAFAADVWTYKINIVVKQGDAVRVVVTTYVNNKEYAGREMNLDYNVVKDLTTPQFLALITNQVKYIVQQDNEEHLIKQKLKNNMNTEISLP